MIAAPLPRQVMIEPKDASEYDRVTQQHVIIVEKETEKEYVTDREIRFPKFAWQIVAY